MGDVGEKQEGEGHKGKVEERSDGRVIGRVGAGWAGLRGLLGCGEHSDLGLSCPRGPLSNKV